MAREWNEAQIRAIDSLDKNTLVSASAGSGKTAVTIERIVRIIKQGTPVRNIVMLAFSNAVAAELKDRISSALVEAMREEGADKEYIREQIDDVSMADICTVHSFCGNLIKEFFEEAGIDPSYSMLEPSERDGMLDKAVDAVIKRYGEKADPIVSALKFMFGNDYAFRAQIKRVYGFLESQPDRDGWLNNAHSGYGFDGQATAAMLSEYENMIAQAGAEARSLADAMNEYPGFDPDNRVEAEMIARSCEAAVGKKGKEFLDAVCAINWHFAAGRKMAKAKLIAAADEVGVDYAIADLRYDELKAIQKTFAATCAKAAKEVKKITAYTSSQWAEYGENTVPYVRKLIQIVCEVAEEYKEQKLAENKMDFADLEYYAIKVLKNPEVSQEVSSRYKYVCIDEYQDTNYVQEFVLRHISDGHNLFMVGDVKQSIYGFRLTEPEIFIGKFDDYGADASEGEVVVLNKNYRSDRRILDFVNEIFSRLMTKKKGGVDYAANSMLETDKPPAYDDGLPVIGICPVKKTEKAVRSTWPADGVYSVREDVPDGEDDAEAEAMCIAEKIASLVGKRKIGYYEDDKPASRYVDYKDITLLCSTRSPRVQKIIRYLHSVGIPVAGANVTQSEENFGVNMLLDLLRVVDNPLQDVALTAVMKSVFGGFDCSELAGIRKAYLKEEYFHTCTRLYADEKNDALAQKLKAFYADLQDLRDKSAQESAGRLLEYAIAKYSFDKYVLAHFGRDDLDKMRAFVAGLEGKSYAVTLQSMLAYEEEAALSGESAERPEDDNCVQTSTIHSSKGLEYPVVILMDAASSFLKRNPSDMLLDKDFGIAMKYPEEKTRLKRNTLKYAACKSKLDKKNLEERLRLMYVALTRAKNMLFITGTVKDFAKGRLAEESFMNWLNNVCVDSPEFCEKYVENYEAADVVEEVGAEEGGITFAAPEPEKLKEIREYLYYVYPYSKSAETGIKHTVTGINKENPDDYGTIYVKNWFEEDSAGTGTAYHKVMEHVDYDSHDEKAVAAQIDELCEKGVLDDAERQVVDPAVVFRCLCSDVITRARAVGHLREKQFMLRVKAKDVLGENAPDDKILVQGTIDLLIEDRADGTATVVDFKMSKLPPDTVAARYRKQLELYALAVEKGLGFRVKEKLIYVLGRDLILHV